MNLNLKGEETKLVSLLQSLYQCLIFMAQKVKVLVVWYSPATVVWSRLWPSDGRLDSTVRQLSDFRCCSLPIALL